MHFQRARICLISYSTAVSRLHSSFGSISQSLVASMKPVRPTSIMSHFGNNLKASIEKEMEEMQLETTNHEEMRDSLFKTTRKISKNNGKIQFAVRNGDPEQIAMPTIAENVALMESALESIGYDDIKRSEFLSHSIQNFTEIQMMHHFFDTGLLADPTHFQPCNDEEYLAAALSFAQELARYSVGRACEDDHHSIAICRDLILQLNGKMLEMDFRNGPLRRRFDGLKYALKNIEDITYELSLVSSLGEKEADGNGNSKKRKLEVELIPTTHLDEIKVRMDAYDKLREQVIKDSRDVQKLSKQAIFSIHRGNLEGSQKQLDDAYVKALAILALIEKTPTLRNGSFSNSLEEWAEGKMTLQWALDKTILSKADMAIVNTSEYIGALSDFTGEIGRMAVASAVKRDIERVKEVQQADVVISSALMLINVGGKYNKKVSAVQQNLKKVEDVVYELSLQAKGGKAHFKEEAPPMDGKGNDDEA